MPVTEPLSAERLDAIAALAATPAEVTTGRHAEAQSALAAAVPELLAEITRLRAGPGYRQALAESGLVPPDQLATVADGVTTTAPGVAAAAFAASQAIRAGLWDAHLRVLGGAIAVRQRQLAEEAT